MFRLEQMNPSLKLPFLNGPVLFLPNPSYSVNDLSGIDLGKFFSRVFHVKGIVKKVPRIIAGAASGALIGGGWAGAAAGAVSAAAFRRKAGTSLFQDIYRGGLYGMIGGGAVGAGKIALGKTSEAGLLGKGYEYINKTFFGPKPTIQYEKPIGPEIPVKTSLPGEIESGIKYPTIQGPCVVPGECPLPSQNKVSSLWSDVWDVTKKVVPEALPVVTKFGEKTLDYMTAKEQLKAAEYAAALSQVAQGESGIISGFNPFSIGPVSGPGSLAYSGFPSGVPSDITGSSSSVGGGTAFPISSQEIPSEGKIEESPWYMNPFVLVGGGGVLLYILMK